MLTEPVLRIIVASEGSHRELRLTMVAKGKIVRI